MVEALAFLLDESGRASIRLRTNSFRQATRTRTATTITFAEYQCIRNMLVSYVGERAVAEHKWWTSCLMFQLKALHNWHSSSGS